MARILLDSCVWGSATGDLCRRGHHAIWAGDWESDPGDDEIIARAYDEGRVLVTLDKDFGELAVFNRRPHRGIIRLVGFRAIHVARVVDHLVQEYEGDLSSGALVTATPQRVRIRRSDG